MKKMLINASDQEEYRVAIVDDGHLEEFYTDSSLKEQTRGNIYKGVITNVEPALQAVFVDIGLSRNGFLQANEIHPEYFQTEVNPKTRFDLKKALRKGQEILVQATKEETGNKGAALTTYISLAGRYAVLSPGRDKIGVSRQIENETERERLKSITDKLPRNKALGYILRTAAEGRTKKEIIKDLNYLLRLWDEIRKSVPKLPAPCLVHKEEDLAIRTIRDYYSPEIEEILIDDAEIYEKAVEYMKLVSPRGRKVVKLYKEPRPIFAKHQVEDQIATVYSNTVRLKSGGSIVINPTEALVAIDVNSGRSTKEGKLEDTAYKVNLEAAEEAARQLMLRDLGGLIVIDFIDMREAAHNRGVEKAFKDQAKKDKAKIDVGRISKYGLLELSRQRLRPPIEFATFQPCPFCAGRGVVRSPEATALAALRAISQRVIKGNVTKVKGRLHPNVASYLQNRKRADLTALEINNGVEIFLEPARDVSPGDMDLEFIKREEPRS